MCVIKRKACNEGTRCTQGVGKGGGVTPLRASPRLGTTKARPFSPNALSRFKTIFLDDEPSTSHLTVSFYLWSSSSNARPLMGTVSAQKALQGYETSELLGGTEEEENVVSG